MQKLFNCLTIVFVSIMFVSCNGKESAKQTEENVVIESDIDEITIKDIILLSYDSTSFHKVFDTTEFNNCLSRMEELILELQDFHVESLADTAVLIDKLHSLELFSELSAFDFNPERLLHSQRVRVYQILLSFLDELIRIEEEWVSVGYPEATKAKTMKEDRDMIEFRDALQKTLYRELN